MSITLLIIIGVIVLILLWGLLSYNGLIAARNRVRQCRSGICVALKQRNDMLPNLVGAAKAYMGYENEVLTKITMLRAAAMSARTDADQIHTGGELSALVGRLKVAVENYPELKADRQFIKLQDSIIDMEDELQAIRRTYNAAVTLFNNKVEMFPSSIIAGMGHFQLEELIEIPQSEAVNVNIGELFSK